MQILRFDDEHKRFENENEVTHEDAKMPRRPVHQK
jgi:hypothetical protein